MAAASIFEVECGLVQSSRFRVKLQTPIACNSCNAASQTCFCTN